MLDFEISIKKTFVQDGEELIILNLLLNAFIRQSHE